MNNNSDAAAPQGECQNISYHLPKWTENGEVIWDDATAQHKSLNAEAHCIKPPTKVIPVIFIPGIMGTNLKDKKDKSIWRADLVKGADTLYLLWKSSNERRNILNVKTTLVDNQGKIKPSNHTVFSDDGNLFPSRAERNWGEALYLSYGEFLDIFQTTLIDDWQKDILNIVLKHKPTSAQEYVSRKGIISNLEGQLIGETQDTPLTHEEIAHFKHFLFPVHVFGYNWLVDNAVSAAQLAKYIDKVIETYKQKHGYGLAIEKVIIVTHSMGGLIARYAMNPPEGSFQGCQDRVLGVVHGVIPDLGSPAAYRRMKTGAGKEGTAGLVLGKNAEELMPVLAFAPAPLQLLPSSKYSTNWLKFDNGESYPKKDPFEEIYLRNDVWWRLYEPDILDNEQAAITENNKSYTTLMKDFVRTFINHMDERKYHPYTYVFYGNEVKSDGFLTWIKENKVYRNPYTGQPVIPQHTTHDRQIIQLPNGEYCEYLLTQSNTAGDGTVPVESLNEIKKHPLLKGWLATNVDHQDAYEVSGLNPKMFSEAIKFTLQSIIKMVQEVDIRAAD
ncbi:MULTISPECIES: triacylglycerol lipase [Providencia]|uniref:esterase/lipase family protein n=1 Tax=Providencia TaxID=586 RepID=UPI00235F2A8E|nr:hypothetical protein [Providencia rettgeri]